MQKSKSGHIPRGSPQEKVLGDLSDEVTDNHRTKERRNDLQWPSCVLQEHDRLQKSWRNHLDGAQKMDAYRKLV